MKIFIKGRFSLVLLTVVWLSGCKGVWNSPYSEPTQQNKILYTVFNAPPKHLDPARSYSSDELILIDNIYEPPLQYHYLKRPYELIPLTVRTVPQQKVEYVDGKKYYVYELLLKKNIFYAPHPAFKGHKRELHAKDYVYQIKRLADPKNHSPIASIMAKYIEGFKAYQEHLRKQTSMDNRYDTPMSGLKVISPYHYKIYLKREYPRFKYWLAMTFFAPMPEEVIVWHETQKKRDSNHLGIDWSPIGTGAFMMTENNPNYRIVLEKNPNFHGEKFPTLDSSSTISLPEDIVAYAGQELPLLDKVIFVLEKESIPYWQKFLQGYYDASGVQSDNFDQAIVLNNVGNFTLSEEFRKKKIKLRSRVDTSVYYFAFNMLSDKVGGYEDKDVKLRQAISIAINYEEYIAIFLNNRGIVAQSPIPPGIFGHQNGQQGINPWVYDWVEGKPRRKPISYAKELLSQAGYPDGIDPKTGEKLSINFEAVGGTGGLRSSLQWIARQLEKINIKLNIRLTDYIRFREKIFTKQAEFFGWGWSADYPDPENFLFLLYAGDNETNYKNAEYDRLYEKMVLLPNNQERLEVIQRMLEIIRRDSPWVWGWNPMRIGLYHQWVDNVIPDSASKNFFKYRSINVPLRQQSIAQWNQPNTIPLVISIVLLLSALTFTIIILRRRQKRSIK